MGAPMEEDSDIPDTEVFGKSTRWEVVRADAGDQRPWLAKAPICPLLKTHHIAHVGRMWASAPFEVIRSEASGTFALIGLQGEGETLKGSAASRPSAELEFSILLSAILLSNLSSWEE